MTRETKAGVVVSAAFLCLVGTVIWVKMRDETHPHESKQPEQQVAAAEVKPTELPPGGAPELVPPPNSIQTNPPAPLSTGVTGLTNVPETPTQQPAVEPLTQVSVQVPPPPTGSTVPMPARVVEKDLVVAPPPVGGSAVPLPPPSNVVPAPAVEPTAPPPPPSGNGLLFEEKQPSNAGAVVPPPPSSATPSESLVKPVELMGPPAPKELEENRVAASNGEKEKKREQVEKNDQLPLPPPPNGSPLPPVPTSGLPLDNGPPPPVGVGLTSLPLPEEKKEKETKPVPAVVAPVPVPSPSPSPAPVVAAPSPAIVAEPPLPGAVEPKPSDVRPVIGKPEPLAPIAKPATAGPPTATLTVPEHSEFIPKGPATPPDTLVAPQPAPGTAPAPTAGARLDGIKPMPIGGEAPPATPTWNPAPDRASIDLSVPAQPPGPQRVAQPPMSPMPLAPIGAAATATTPPITLPEMRVAAPLPPPQSFAPPATANAIAVSYDETTHRVANGDSFKAISKTYYGSEDYARALEQWNMNHPRASASMARDGSLSAGDRVFIPPAKQLEQRYSALVPKSVALPTANANGTQQASFVAPASVPDFTYYKAVREESVEAIARTTLGAGRVNDLLRLNPNLRADSLVPGGTTLLLPGSANVPAENVRR